MASQAQAAQAYAPTTPKPVRPINFARVDLLRTDAPNGTVVLRAATELEPHEPLPRPRLSRRGGGGADTGVFGRTPR